MTQPVGWIGAGRMGSAMVRRLVADGTQVRVWNRTASRATALEEDGATAVATLADAAAQPLVVTSLAASRDLEDVAQQLTEAPHRPNVVVDTSTVSVDASRRVRELLQAHDVRFLSAPVSGNPGAVAAGSASFVCSGDQQAFEAARPLLERIGVRATYIGGADEARVVKIAHNLLLATVTQGLAEVVTLCAQRGVAAEPLMEFLNNSVMGSAFTRYKTPAIVSHDLTPTFTTQLLLKDLDLGLDESTATRTPLPVVSLVRSLVLTAIAQGMADDDFLSLLAVQTRAAGLTFRTDSTRSDS